MAEIFKTSEAATIAIHAMAVLAGKPDEIVRAGEIAEGLGVSENHLLKILQRLGRAKLVRSTRGPSGGYSLARDAKHISLKEVFEAVEGPVEADACVFGVPVCAGDSCVLGRFLNKINRQVLAKFENTKLSQIKFEI